MTVVMTSEAAGKKVDETYTGPLEPFLLAEGYARRTDVSTKLPSTGALGVAVADDPRLNENREAPGEAVSYEGNLAAPDIAATTPVTPATGGIAGGTAVVITGDSFTGLTALTFGGTAATSFEVVDDETVNAVTPAHAAGAVNVVATDADGSDTAVGAFTYA